MFDPPDVIFINGKHFIEEIFCRFTKNDKIESIRYLVPVESYEAETGKYYISESVKEAILNERVTFFAKHSQHKPIYL